ncbi:hypothetical protein Taro_019127 [Colocasia esculenta]|uniref:Uncharacterized protein n=1 Tax=Colocasia esculenta TaxID=4460 RepID=A0A843UVJ6_COLES|nr:hypothetical protein [Colocasia esculenta]
MVFTVLSKLVTMSSGDLVSWQFGELAGGDGPVGGGQGLAVLVRWRLAWCKEVGGGLAMGAWLRRLKPLQDQETRWRLAKRPAPWRNAGWRCAADGSGRRQSGCHAAP